MAESADEKYSRLQQMLLDDGQTWDLSPHDKEAIRFVMGMANQMADELAQDSGRTVPHEWKRVAAIVEKGDS